MSKSFITFFIRYNKIFKTFIKYFEYCYQELMDEFVLLSDNNVLKKNPDYFFSNRDFFRQIALIFQQRLLKNDIFILELNNVYSRRNVL